MRTTASVKPRFWSSGSGKKLRGKPNAQVLAVYLMSSPHSTMIGLYYESLVSILHETGLSEADFRQALTEVGEIARYDEEAGLVFLPNGAEHQIGETLSVKDKKRVAILSQLRTYGKHPFVKEWVARYYDPYQLSYDGIANPSHDAPSMPHPVLHPPSKGHARLVHAPDPRSESESDPDPREKSQAGEQPPIVADVHTRARLWVRDPFLAATQYPQPERWSETAELNQLVADAFGVEPDTLTSRSNNGTLDPRVQAVLGRWAEGIEQARLREAIRGATHDDLIRGKPQLQSLVTILKDSNAVDKYCRLARKAGTPSKANVERLTDEARELRRKYRAREI